MSLVERKFIAGRIPQVGRAGSRKEKGYKNTTSAGSKSYLHPSIRKNEPAGTQQWHNAKGGKGDDAP
jgi:hypothetical protein